MRIHPAAAAIAPVLIPALGLAVIWAVLPAESFWCMDEANRFLQTHALALTGAGIPPALPYPGSGLVDDPALMERLRPLPGQYGFIRDGRLYSQYSPLLALSAVPFYAVFGQRGIYVPVLIGGTVLAVMLSGMLRSLGHSRRTSLLLAFLTVPVPFYSLTFFSHGMALLLVLAGLMLLRRGLLTAALLASALAAAMRVETVFALPLMLFMTHRKPTTKGFFLAAALCAALYLLLQRTLTGSWLGTHLASSGTQSLIYGTTEGSWLQNRWVILRRAFINAMPGYRTDGLILGSVLWGLWGFSRVRAGTAAGVLSARAGMALSLIPMIALFFRGLRSTDTMDVQNPLLIFPLLWLAAPSRGTLYAAAAGAVAMLCLMSPMHAEDVAWGFRHGMPLFLLLCLAPPVPGHSRLTGWAVAAGVLATAASMSLLAARRVRGDELLDIADRQGVPVIATSWEQPQELAPLIIAGTPVMHASTTRDLYSALRLFDHREPLVMVRRESVALLSAVLEAAEMTWEPQGAGPAGDPTTDVLVFRCRRR